LNDTGGICEAPHETEPAPYEESLALFDADPYSVAATAGDPGEDINVKGTVAGLALHYVYARRMAGEINERTAEQLRSRLLDFAHSVPSNPRRVYRRHVEAWMARPDLRPQYRRSRLSALRGFTKWCVSEGHMAKDPCLMVPMPKVPPQLPKRLTEDEARALVATAKADRRTLLICLLMLQEGLRRTEVSRLDVEDVDFAEKSLVIRGKGGDGGYTDALPITTETWKALTAYLAEAGHTTGPLIRNRVRKHGRTAPQTVSELVRQTMVDAGVKRPGDALRTPHSTRHTTAHAVLAKTGDIRTVQKVLRHRSVRSSEVYLRGYVDDLRPAMEGRTYGNAS
jgi:site-specific recombinase XerD